MEKLPAKNGWLWIKEGVRLFRQQPAEISTLFLICIFLTLALILIPMIGLLLVIILMPVFEMLFMQACRHIEEGKRVYPKLLLAGLRSPALGKLLLLGVLRLLLAFAVFALVGIFLDVRMDIQEIENGINSGLMVVTLADILMRVMCWFAAPLIAWQNMSLGKALFYSFFAACRAAKAFLLYGLIWLLILILLLAIVSVIIAVTGIHITIGAFIIPPLLLILAMIMCCSFYPAYADVFGSPVHRDDRTSGIS